MPGFAAARQNWEAPVSSSCAVEWFFLKLQRLSRGLKKWSQRKVGNVRSQLAVAKEILHRLEIAREMRDLSQGEEWLRRKLKLHCLGLASLERTFARLRSRVLYLQEGDANTTFFHQHARYRKKKKFIAKFINEGQTIVSQQKKLETATVFYDTLLGTAEDREFTFDLPMFHSKSLDLSSLDMPFTMEEVWATVKDMPLDKATGPDGFTGRFYSSCWDIIRDDVLEALHAVCRGHVSKFRLLNSDFITLLPKKTEALMVKDYRPISFVHSFANAQLPLHLSWPSQAMQGRFPDCDCKVAAKLPSWKRPPSPLLNKAGRLVVVKSVLTAVTIHLLIAWDLPKWVIKAIEKIRRGFLWKGQEQANGGNSLVSWRQVQSPLCFGGLGVLDLELLSWALRVDISVGSGATMLFWSDRWLHGKTVAELAPNLIKLIPKRVVKRHTVSQALENRSWVSDIQGALTVRVLVDYLLIWDLVEGFTLQPEVPDQYRWKLSSSGVYSSKTAYRAMFVGSIKFSPCKRIWKSWAPPNCKFFTWLAINNRCWTSDRLAKHGLPHQPACPFCDQDVESIHHILTACVFSREVWTWVLRKLNLTVVTPHASSRFNSQASRLLRKGLRKGFNSLVILVSWELWKHRNACVFEGARPHLQLVLTTVASEGLLWCRAGASGIQELLLRTVPGP
ncbi:hypothetical protein U9M48_004630 [Paspalum notatum var. saurae]|uniref:Reverse transcriptase zinc-binding domain-containing protein n=1 Tax=Paspalum notatum var. saurae TaxID=547442 RepID=A0AAQ3PN21_PASNO